MMPILLTAEEAARELRIGRTRMFDLIRTGEVVSVMVGGSRRVPYAELQAYVRRLLAQQSDELSDTARGVP